MENVILVFCFPFCPSQEDLRFGLGMVINKRLIDRLVYLKKK